jgi:hypothetical protein
MIATYSSGCASATGVEASMNYMTRNTFGRVYNSSCKQLYAVLDLYFNQATFKRTSFIFGTECVGSVQNIDRLYIWHDWRIECADRSALVVDGIVICEKQC